MIEPISDMPQGTVGFRFSGDIAAADYSDVVAPRIRELIDGNEPIRILLQIGPDFHEEFGSLWEGAKFDFEFGVKHWSAWKRTAVVTDVEWIRRSTQLFAWMMPGDAKVFSQTELAEAKTWVAS